MVVRNLQEKGSHSGSKEGQELKKQTAIESDLLTRMVQNTTKFLENLDFKGIFSLVKGQIKKKTEKLHVIIQNIRERNFDPRKEFSKSRATIVNVREKFSSKK